jgi:hypothetical protein
MPSPVVTIERIGAEREPVIVIDGFSGRIAELAALGRAALYEPQSMYPGMRSPADPAYLAPMQALLHQMFSRVFGLGKVKVEGCDYSVVSLAPGALSSAQSIPHYDDAGPGVLALLHYTQGPETGGTAFYRHRRTGFESLRPERLAAYAKALADDEREYGPVAAGYIGASTERFERIAVFEARPDRAILYRGRTLHSGMIPQAPDPASALADGRLTINTFFAADG